MERGGVVSGSYLNRLCMNEVCTRGKSLFFGGGSGNAEYYGRETIAENVRLLPREVRMGGGRFSVVLLVLAGQVEITLNGGERMRVGAGRIVLFPPEGYYVVSACEEEAHLLAYGIEELLEMWEGEMFPVTGAAVAPSGERATALAMNERLWEYALNLSGYLADGVSGPRFMRMKAFEFIHLLRFYYPRRELAAFFAPLLNEHTDFTRIVMDNWCRVRSKAELAAIAGLSTSRFGVKFREVFGTSPYQWMMSRRSERIYQKLVYGTESLKEISEEFHFGSVQHFNDFCKKRFGTTPGRLRSRRGIGAAAAEPVGETVVG